jgi:hypothetical protein
MSDADKLMRSAESALSSAGKGFSFFSNKEDKFQEAADSFRDAG